MKQKKKPAMPVPVALDDDLIAEIDGVADEKKASRSAVMRMAIRAGLPIVKSGGAGDSLTLDSETDREVMELVNYFKKTRSFVLLAAIRKGLTAVNGELLRNSSDPKEAEAAFIFRDKREDTPLLEEIRKVKLERFEFEIQLLDLFQQCPEARERKEVIERVVALHRKQYGSWPSMWGKGVDTEELKRQIAKYGPPETASSEASVAENSVAAAKRTADNNLNPTQKPASTIAVPKALWTKGELPDSPVPAVTDQAAEKPTAKPKRAKGKK